MNKAEGRHWRTCVRRLSKLVDGERTAKGGAGLGFLDMRACSGGHVQAGVYLTSMASSICAYRDHPSYNNPMEDLIIERTKDSEVSFLATEKDDVGGAKHPRKFHPVLRRTSGVVMHFAGSPGQASRSLVLQHENVEVSDGFAERLEQGTANEVYWYYEEEDEDMQERVKITLRSFSFLQIGGNVNGRLTPSSISKKEKLGQQQPPQYCAHEHEGDDVADHGHFLSKHRFEREHRGFESRSFLIDTVNGLIFGLSSLQSTWPCVVGRLEEPNSTTLRCAQRVSWLPNPCPDPNHGATTSVPQRHFGSVGCIGLSMLTSQCPLLGSSPNQKDSPPTSTIRQHSGATPP